MMIGASEAFLNVVRQARVAAASGADVVIEGESGCGKELIARLIHAASARAAQPFVAVNCAAVPEALLESELFGYVRGAFTGAIAAKRGKFEQANGGTLLLDEIGEMPLALQPKLLRALQEREIERLGDLRPMPLDMRVIATTNRDLRAMVAAGTFRADLFYRLYVIPLRLPPLRDRRSDIPMLAAHFAKSAAAQFGGKVPEITPEFMSKLVEYRWPGNVRELANYMRRIVALSRGECIRPEHFELEQTADELSQAHAGTRWYDAERQLLARTLDAAHGNRTRAAEMLGVSLRTVRNKIRLYGLPPKETYA